MHSFRAKENNAQDEWGGGLAGGGGRGEGGRRREPHQVSYEIERNTPRIAHASDIKNEGKTKKN